MVTNRYEYLAKLILTRDIRRADRAQAATANAKPADK
jgi:hypothetical protein